MSRYKEADALKIKQEIAILQKERSELEESIASGRDELQSIKDGITIWRGVFTKVNESIVARVQSGTAQLEEVIRKKDVVVDELSEGEKLLTALKASISEARRHTPEDTTGFARGVLLTLQRKITELTSRKDAVETDIDNLLEEQKSLDVSLKKLTQDKLAAIEQMRKLMDAIAAGKEKYSDVMLEITKCEDTLKAIERRERDSRILMDRLSDDYRKAYMKRHGALDS